MRVGLSCPNLAFVQGSEEGEASAQRLKDLGFPISMRAAAGGVVMLAPEGIIGVELVTIEDLVALQDRIGFPLKLEPGPMLEIQAI